MAFEPIALSDLDLFRLGSYANLSDPDPFDQATMQGKVIARDDGKSMNEKKIWRKNWRTTFPDD